MYSGMKINIKFSMQTVKDDRYFGFESLFRDFTTIHDTHLKKFANEVDVFQSQLNQLYPTLKETK